MSAATALLAVLVAGTVVWLTIGRSMLAVARAASELPVGPSLRLLDQPTCVLDDVTLAEIVVLGDDVLVSFVGHGGSWFRRDHADGTLVAVDGRPEVKGELLFPHAALDSRARRLLMTWITEPRVLVAVLNEALGLAALVDEGSRQALIVDLAHVLRGDPKEFRVRSRRWFAAAGRSGFRRAKANVAGDRSTRET